MIETSTRCPFCAAHVVLHEGHGYWFANCDACLDPDGESPRELLQGRGATPEDALDHWWQRMEELDIEPAYAPSALASFIVPSAPAGWGLHTIDGTTYYGPMPQKAANDT